MSKRATPEVARETAAPLSGPVHFAIDGEFTIYRAAELKLALLQALERGASLELDLSRVTDLDTAGVQLLLLAKKVAEARGKALKLGELSPAAREVFALVNLASHFGTSASSRSEAP